VHEAAPERGVEYLQGDAWSERQGAIGAGGITGVGVGGGAVGRDEEVVSDALDHEKMLPAPGCRYREPRPWANACAAP
jgi:hypothetical protein